MIVHHETTVELAGGQLEILREQALDRLVEFNGVVRAWWRGTTVVAGLPKAPGMSMAAGKFLRPMRDGLRLWDRLNAGVAPSGIVLPLKLGAALDFARADMQVLVDAMVAAQAEQEAGEFELKMARAERDGLERRIWEVLVAYAQAVPVRLGPKSVSAQTLPRLSPRPGHTPEAVKLTGTWDGEREALRLAWTASEDEKLESYQVRMCQGAVYDKKVERVAMSVGKDEDREAWMSQRPGVVAAYRVYVMLTTGNERGSATLVVGAEGLGGLVTGLGMG